MGTKKRKEYSLSDIFSLFMKRLWIILLCTVIFASASFMVSKYVIDEKYMASVSMYVDPHQGDADAAATLSDLYYAQTVVQTYIEILKTDEFIRRVAEASGLEYSVSDLKRMMRIEIVNETEIFRVQITSTNPRHSLKLAYTVALLAPEKIMDIKGADAVRVVDQATMPTSPVSPDILLNTLIGLFLGVAISMISVLLADILDNRIKNEDDIIKHYNVPILGSVPRFKN